MLTRRKLLLTATALPLAGCVTNPTTGQTTLSPAVIDFITNAVAIAAHYAPTAESIAAEAASLFGPQYVAIVQVGSAAINQLIAYLTNLIAPPATPTPAAHRLAAKLKAAAPGAALVGYTTNGVPIYGFTR